ncbi:ATP-binding protein [Campylobacter ureolyticus]|uniref:ATP-binding protein n=1 Tax=Campylobacter ureolyticus TaxID=827 RepID=UPI002889D712|nr:ATP-binding protein [Campylobacter ureolyticus]
MIDEVTKQAYAEYEKNGGSFRKLGALLKMNQAYVSMAFNGWGDYALSSEKKAVAEKKIVDFFNSKRLSITSQYDEICKNDDILPFTNTIIIMASVIKAIKQRALLKIIGKSGTGKTTAIKALIKKLPQAVLISSYAGMSKKELLENIAKKIKAQPERVGTAHLMSAIKDALKGSDKVIIIDEANFISTISLEQIRHIQDETNTPIILVGTENLQRQILNSHEQVITRIRNTHQPLKSFSENEVIMLFEKSKIEIDEKMATKIWKRCKNLREVKYALDDLVEIYKGNISKIDEVLPRDI